MTNVIVPDPRPTGLPAPRAPSLWWRLRAAWARVVFGVGFEWRADGTLVTFRPLRAGPDGLAVSRALLVDTHARLAAIPPGTAGFIECEGNDALAYNAHDIYALRRAMARAVAALRASERVGLMPAVSTPPQGVSAP